MRILNFINGLQGVGPGNVATADLPVGRRYHVLKAFVSGDVAVAGANTNPADLIAQVRLVVDGREIRNLLPADVINIAKTNGLTPDTDNGELPFYFSEPWRASVLGEELTSWDFTNVRKAVLEITFNSAVGVNAINSVALAVEASFDYAQNFGPDGKTPLLNIIKQLRQTQSVPAGQSSINNLDTTYPIQRAHFRISAGTIDAMEIDNNSQKILEGLTEQIQDFYRDYKLDPDNFSFSAIFDHTQQISDAMFPRNQNVTYKPTCSAGGTLTAILEQRVPGYL